MKKSTCSKCNNEFSNRGGYTKHVNSCDGFYRPFVKLKSCKYCSLDFSELNTNERANHSRWCLENPKRSSYTGGISGTQLHTPEAKAKRALSIKKAYADGKYDNVVRKGPVGYKHTDASKALISQAALASKHRRLVRSMREYVKKDGTSVMLDSSWEEALAKRLDDTGIEWIRPEEPIPYITSDGKTHNYFPDFYLPEYDLYLDPKNPAAINAQKDKLEVLLNMMNNLVIIGTLRGCEQYQLHAGPAGPN